MILSRGPMLDVPLSELKQRRGPTARDDGVRVTTLEDAEREHIRRALEEANWRVGGPAGAAARLGMKRTTLQSKMAKLGIERPAAGVSATPNLLFSLSGHVARGILAPCARRTDQSRHSRLAEPARVGTRRTIGVRPSNCEPRAPQALHMCSRFGQSM